MSRIRIRHVILIPFVGGALITNILPALGFSRGGVSQEDLTPISKCGPNITFRFVGTTIKPAWTTAEMNAVRAAFNSWDAVVDRDGTSVVTTTESTATPTINVSGVSAPDGLSSNRSFGKCDAAPVTGRLQIRVDKFANLAVLQGLATHEVGHILGLAHTGRGENQPQTASLPTMTTGYCIDTATEDTSYIDEASLTRDDHAGLLARQGISTERDFHADPSFERTQGVWDGNDAVLTFVDGTDDPRGDKHLQFTGTAPAPTGASPVVHQYVRVFRPGAVVGGFWVRKVLSSATGNVNVKVNSEKVQGWNDDFPFVCDPPPGDFLNQRSMSLAPTTVWQFFELNPFTFTVPSLGQIEIRVTNSLTVSCPEGTCRTAAGLDYTRVRGI